MARFTMVEENDRLARQLRTYGEALEASHFGLPIDMTGTPEPDRHWGRPLLIAAALMVVLAGSATLLRRHSGDSFIETDVTDEVTTTSALEPDPILDDEPKTELRVLPALDDWSLIHSETSNDQEVHTSGGIWTWRVDGKLVMVVSPFRGDVAVSVAQPEITAENNRVMLGWQSDGETIGMQGIGFDESRILELAASLVRTAEGWELPDGEPVVSSNGGPRVAGRQTSATYSAVDGDGFPGLASAIQVSVTPGDEGEIYRLLFEGSSMGNVREATILGHGGFVIEGPLGSIAVVAFDGTLVSIQAIRSDVDISGFVQSLSVVSDSEWELQKSQISQNLSRAAEHATEDDYLKNQTQPDPISLPRYVLPDPAELEWVTDFSLWTDQERAQREALGRANASGHQETGDLILMQGFIRDSSADSDLPVPEILLSVRDYGPDASPDLDRGDTNPFFFGEYSGYSSSNAGGLPLSFVTFGDERFYISVSSHRSSEDELREFVRSLTLVGTDPSEGFEPTGAFALTAVRTSFLDIVRQERWYSGYVGESEAEGGPRVHVNQVTPSEFLISLAQPAGLFGTTVEAVGDNLYTLTPDVVELEDRGIEVRPFVTVVRYNPTAGYAIYLTMTGEIEEALELFASLIEVDLETWTELVDPINSEPLAPR